MESAPQSAVDLALTAYEPQDMWAPRQELEAITDLMQVAASTCTRDFYYKWVSRRFAEWLGKPREAIIGSRIIDVIGPSAFSSLKEHFHRVLAGACVEYEEEVEYAELGRRSIRASYVPTRERDGTVSGWFAVILDNSDRKQLDLAREARDAAERANQAKGRFLAAASHDLRQPLQTLSLLNGTLRRLVTDADATQVAAQQQLAITAMSALLNALLDISKLEAGGVKPQISTFNLGVLFQELSVEFSEPAAAKGLHLEMAAPSEFAISDRTLFGEMLRNLLSNAIRYTRTGSVRLLCERDNENLKIEVRDTGIGIPNEHLGDIFEEFYQVGAPANRAREGHGLGLNIVQRVAQLLNHEMRVESEIGKGSIFSVIVPAGVAQRHARIGPQSVDSPSASAPRAHVLIVDDDLAVLDATRLLLKVEGYRVTIASSFDEALKKARENADIELLITDFHLSDRRLGTEVVRCIREILGRHICAVLISGDTSRAMTDISDSTNLRGISKPVKADELLVLLSDLIRDARA